MLIYDYDGVLMDSVREVAVTAHNMLTGEIITRLDQIPTNALALFLKNRFHDDSVKNLCEIDAHFNIDKKLVSLILAEWGYTGPDDARLAESLGYQTVAIDEFMDQLKRCY